MKIEEMSGNCDECGDDCVIMQINAGDDDFSGIALCEKCVKKLIKLLKQ